MNQFSITTTPLLSQRRPSTAIVNSPCLQRLPWAGPGCVCPQSWASAGEDPAPVAPRGDACCSERGACWRDPRRPMVRRPAQHLVALQHSAQQRDTNVHTVQLPVLPTGTHPAAATRPRLLGHSFGARPRRRGPGQLQDRLPLSLRHVGRSDRLTARSGSGGQQYLGDLQQRSQGSIKHSPWVAKGRQSCRPFARGVALRPLGKPGCASGGRGHGAVRRNTLG